MKKVFNLLSGAGIGDALLTTPVFKAVKRQSPDCKVRVFCLSKAHLEIYKNNPYIDRLSMAIFWQAPVDRIIYHFRPDNYHNNFYENLEPSKFYRVHASKIIGEMVKVEVEDEDLQIFLTKEEEAAAAKAMAAYRNPVVIHVTSLTSSNQQWPLENWDELVKILPDYTFIQIGLASEPKVAGAIDLRGKTLLREAIAIMKYAKSFVGVCSSMSHATSAVGLPSVVLFGPSTPLIWGHRNNINIYKSLPCAPCIDILFNSKCPNNTECMRNITIKEVRDALVKQVEGNKHKNAAIIKTN